MQTLFASLPLSFFSDLGQQFYDDFILKDRYMYIVQGFGNTVAITLVAVIIGIILGTLVALVRITHQNNPKKLRILNKICGLYLTVIRGTPVLVQLMIMVYFIFASGKRFWWQCCRSVSIPAPMLPRSFEAASSPWTVARSRLGAPWV